MSLILSEVLNLDEIEFTEEEIRIGAIVLYGESAFKVDKNDLKESIVKDDLNA